MEQFRYCFFNLTSFNIINKIINKSYKNKNKELVYTVEHITTIPNSNKCKQNRQTKILKHLHIKRSREDVAANIRLQGLL